MAFQNVNTLNNGNARYRQSTSFDGIGYVLYFRYNSRDGRWYVDIHDAEDLPIQGFTGRKLVTDWIVGRLSTDPRKLLGTLLIVTQTAIPFDPGLNDLGQAVLMQYITAGES